jgi:hypothetical protein
MKKHSFCPVTACSGGKGVELLGLVLVLIAALLTIISLDSFGIVAMFIVGIFLLGHRHFCRSECSCGSDDCEICCKNAVCHTDKAEKKVDKKA